MSINLNSIRDILNIKDDNIIFSDNFYLKKKFRYVDSHFFFASLSYVPSFCPCCGAINSSNSIVKNGFKSSRIRLLPISNLPAFLVLKKQRFLCRDCGSSFMAESSFVDPYCNLSNDLKKAILIDLMEVYSLKSIARRWHVSPSTVLRVLNSVPPLKNDFSSLPEFICMDEFKSVKSVDFNMSFIFMDAVSRRVIDILPDRRIHRLISYFQRYPIEVRRRVKGVVIDMYEPYITLIQSVFPNAVIIFDRFHIVQNLTRALDRTRISVMNGFARDSQEYKVLKRYWKLFLLNEFELHPSFIQRYTAFINFMSQASIVSFMRDIDPVLDKSYMCVQDILAAIRLSNTDMLSSLFDRKLDSRVSHYVNVAIETCRRYEEFILNACRYKLSNGPLEGKINKIKLIKRNAFGHRNFYNYKKRIILVFEKFRYIENGPDISV
ncbi:ISL3 family transposase [Neofamilia massiliensis]|uniref:ISL3 family transposase n=1 Tax=Neofamilia massiliensis TaxID=1673724 RepID=UPI0006BB870B|nr:ISL3 family transposase [Neofamilia massiliensis]